MRLVGERNEWYTRYMSAINNPDFMPPGEGAVPPEGSHLELDAVDGPGMSISKRVLFIFRRKCTDELEINKCRTVYRKIINDRVI